MTKDEALDLALEALEYIYEGANNQGPHTGISWRCVAVKAEPAIKAIKQARALDKKAENARELGLDYEPADGTQVSKVWWDGERLMAKPIPFVEFYKAATAAPVQEPVAYIEHHKGGDNLVWDDPGGKRSPLYTTPPAAQRPWVGLDWKDMPDIRAGDHAFLAGARWAEDKLKDKNGV